MEMTVSDSLVSLLNRQGMTRGAAGTAGPRGMKSAGVSQDGDGPQVADCPEGGLSNPTGRAGGDWRQMGNSGKGPAVNAPAKFTGLHVVVDNSRCKPMRTERSVGLDLRLVK